ncbi:MarC family protein [Aureivirga sp. CE67]|uniref:MarC family protein n=1 Tax=Aureivirga sp. CE67 TaxID=1788983 RepID=UPI0018CB0A34|nr:MarC family protein [Aureivirga sp. CE67]
MNELFTFGLSILTSFFAVMNPIANTPIFAGLVEEETEENKKKIARKACLIAFVIVVCFIVLGKYIFQLFGITIPAFKITGGILLFYVGFEMLQSKPLKTQHQTNFKIDDSLAISPLAIPILAGPGTIVTAMNFVADVSYIKIAILTLIFGFMMLLTYISFLLSSKIIRFFGNNLIIVIGKIMGLILSIIGTDMFIQGVKIAFSLK